MLVQLEKFVLSHDENVSHTSMVDKLTNSGHVHGSVVSNSMCLLVYERN